MPILSDRRAMQPDLNKAIRRGRRWLFITGQWGDAFACSKVLRSASTQDLVLQQLIKVKGEEIAKTGLGDGTFLQWLKDNWETVLQAILLVLSII